MVILCDLASRVFKLMPAKEKFPRVAGRKSLLGIPGLGQHDTRQSIKNIKEIKQRKAYPPYTVEYVPLNMRHLLHKKFKQGYY